MNFLNRKLSPNVEEIAVWRANYDNYLKISKPLIPEDYPDLFVILKTKLEGAQNPIEFSEVMHQTSEDSYSYYEYNDGYYVCLVPGLYTVTASITTDLQQGNTIRLYKNAEELIKKTS